jgi:hypothetical protein
MTNKKQRAVLQALILLVIIVALALVTTWALLAMGEGTAAVNLKENSIAFSFGGTFALFIGLITIFTKTFKNLILWLTVMVLCVSFGSLFQEVSSRSEIQIVRTTSTSTIIYISLAVGVVTIAVWATLRLWLWGERDAS